MRGSARIWTLPVASLPQNDVAVRAGEELESALSKSRSGVDDQGLAFRTSEIDQVIVPADSHAGYTSGPSGVFHSRDFLHVE